MILNEKSLKTQGFNKLQLILFAYYFSVYFKK